jgi:hypothetical protein
MPRKATPTHGGASTEVIARLSAGDAIIPTSVTAARVKNQAHNLTAPPASRPGGCVSRMTRPASSVFAE